MPSNSLAGTAETMTAEDARFCETLIVMEEGFYARILATYHALAEMASARDECERQFQRQTERVLELMNEVDRLSASLALAQKDGERLDAIERGDVEVECMGTSVPYQNAYAPDGRMYTTAGSGMTLREAIDAAMSPPPETTQGGHNG